jgi:hypothetical protein
MLDTPYTQFFFNFSFGMHDMQSKSYLQISTHNFIF